MLMVMLMMCQRSRPRVGCVESQSAGCRAAAAVVLCANMIMLGDMKRDYGSSDYQV